MANYPDDTLSTRRERHYGLQGVYLSAYCEVVDPDNAWPVSYYVLNRWLRILTAVGFWLLIAIQQLCFRNRRSPKNNWCTVSRDQIAGEAHMAPATVDRLLHSGAHRKHEGYYKTRGLCHWIRFRERRKQSAEAGTQIQDVNHYDIVLTPPLAPIDQRGLAQYLLENGVEPRGSTDTAVPLLERLAATEFYALLDLLEDCAGRFSPPDGWPTDELLVSPDEYMATPYQVVQALGLKMPIEKQEQIAFLDLCDRVYQALCVPMRPKSFTSTNYFRRYWLPLLGHTLAALIVTLRSRCFWNTDELRDEISLYPSEMAEILGLESKQVRRLLTKLVTKRFLTILDSGRGKRTKFQVYLREPIAPEHEQKHQRLLTGESLYQLESGNLERLIPDENGHSEHLTSYKNGHPERLTPGENGHFERLTSGENGHSERLAPARMDILSGGMDILSRGNGHSEHLLSIVITETPTGTSLSLKKQKHPNDRKAATAALLDDFNVGPPNSTRILRLDPEPAELWAWLLYVITERNLVEGGYNVPGYAASHFLAGESAPSRFETWAQLTARDWQTLWRASHYGGPYADGVAEIAHRFQETGWSQEEFLRAWQADFAEVFPQGPFGNEVIDLGGLKRLLLKLSPPGDFHLTENHCTLLLEPADSETHAWLVEHERDVRHLLDAQGILHTARIMDPSSRTGSRGEHLWNIVLSELNLQMTQATFDKWLRDSRFLGHENGSYIIGVGSSYAKEWLEHRLFDTVKRTLVRLSGQDVDIEFVVLGGDVPDSSGTASTTAADPILAEVIGMYESEIGPVTERTAQKLTALVEEHQDIGQWRDAFDAVVWSNVRRLDYVKRCLENERAPKPKRSGRLRTIREKPPAEEVDAETRARQRAALDKLRRRQRERERA